MPALRASARKTSWVASSASSRCPKLPIAGGVNQLDMLLDKAGEGLLRVVEDRSALLLTNVYHCYDVPYSQL